MASQLLLLAARIDSRPQLAHTASGVDSCNQLPSGYLLKGSIGNGVISVTSRTGQGAMAHTLIVWGLDPKDPTYEQQLRVFNEHGELDRCLC